MTRTRLDQITQSIKAHMDQQNRLVDGAKKITPELEIQIDNLNSRIRALEIEREQIEAGKMANLPHLDSRTNQPIDYSTKHGPAPDLEKMRIKRTDQ